MNGANVQVTIEVMVPGDTHEKCKREAWLVVENAMKGHGWSLIVKTQVVAEREDME